MKTRGYRGRLAPSPTGFLHLGHAQTFWIAAERARQARGDLVLRIENIDRARSRREFVDAIIEDLRWLGIAWNEGPVLQSERMELYRAAFEKLRSEGRLYQCSCSRKEILLAAPHAEDDEAVYPGLCRSKKLSGAHNWRFRVSDGEEISFVDGAFGEQRFVAGRDIGDFVVWTREGMPSYQLAAVVDDAEMGITEVVRGADLLMSTGRQLLLYRALGWAAPAFYHCHLVKNSEGARLAKRADALSLRALRQQGLTPEDVRGRFTPPPGPGSA